MTEENDSRTSVGHGLPEELQDLRKDKPEVHVGAASNMAKGVERVNINDRFIETREKKGDAPMDSRIVTGKRMGSGEVIRPLLGAHIRRQSNFMVETSTVKPDKSTSNHISTVPTVGEDDGIAINVWMRAGDGQHRLALFITGLPDDEGNIVLQVRTKNTTENMPLYEVKYKR